MSLNFTVLMQMLEALIEKRNVFIDSIKTKLEFYRTKRWAWGQSICSTRCDSLQWGCFLRMSGKYELQNDTIWERSVSSLVSTLKEIPGECCAGGKVGDHSWNTDLRYAVDKGLKKLEKGLSLSEFPSREAGG
jgi:hypothetical protein